MTSLQGRQPLLISLFRTPAYPAVSPVGPRPSGRSHASGRVPPHHISARGRVPQGRGCAGRGSRRRGVASPGEACGSGCVGLNHLSDFGVVPVWDDSNLDVVLCAQLSGESLAPALDEREACSPEDSDKFARSGNVSFRVFPEPALSNGLAFRRRARLSPTPRKGTMRSGSSRLSSNHCVTSLSSADRCLPGVPARPRRKRTGRRRRLG